MSKSRSSRVLLFDDNDPEMKRAHLQARATFRYFWREVLWDRRRIVPALQLAGVKVPFMDDAPRSPAADTPEVEHMWVSDVDFDGRLVTGVLDNEPKWLKTVKEGDSVSFPVERISDWIFAIGDYAYGAFMVNLIRSRMTNRERRKHDAAWGLEFGDPLKIRMTSENEHQKWIKSVARRLKAKLAKNPTLATEKDKKGWTLLHQDASAGSDATVKVLLEAGADPTAMTNQGMTPLQLAKALEWDSVVAVLGPKRSDGR